MSISFLEVRFIFGGVKVSVHRCRQLTNANFLHVCNAGEVSVVRNFAVLALNDAAVIAYFICDFLKFSAGRNLFSLLMY